MSQRPSLELQTAAALSELIAGNDCGAYRVFDPDLAEQTGDSRRVFLPDGQHPPILVWQGCVIWGFRYIDAACAGNAADSPMPVARLAPDSSAYTAVYALLRQENRLDRYSFGEMDRLERLFVQLGLAGAEQEALDPLVQRKGSFRSHLEQYRALSPTRRAAVSGGTIDVRTAVNTERLPDPVVRSVAAADLGFSKRRIVLTRLAEIAARDQLDSAAIQELSTQVLAAADPVRSLQYLRYPELARRQDRAAGLAERDTAGQRVQIQLPENLEGDSITITCAIRSRQELEQQIQILHGLEEHIDEYLDLL